MNRGFYFTRVMQIGIEGNQIEIPDGIYKKYISEHIEEKDKKVLIDWQNGNEVNFSHIKRFFKASFEIDEPKSEVSKTNVDGFDRLLNDYGIELYNNSYRIIEKKLKKIKSETYDEILLNILRPYYGEINKELFNEDIYLGPYLSTGDEVKQSLYTALRVANIFSLLYLSTTEILENDINLYDEYKFEYLKRAELVKSISIEAKPGEKIFYIPIYDFVSNYKNLDAKRTCAFITKILNNNSISVNDRNEIENEIIKQAEKSQAYTDTTINQIKEDILNPILSISVNIKKATLLLGDAKNIILENSYDTAVNRAYYSMMRALRCILANCGELGKWKKNSLGPQETHFYLEKKLKNEIILKRNLLRYEHLRNFQYVKSQRMLADYEEKYLKKEIAEKCILYAEKFLNEIIKQINI